MERRIPTNLPFTNTYSSITTAAAATTMSNNAEQPSSNADYYVHEQEGSITTNPNRKSRLFFKLCDMRTATVVLNILNIVFTLAVGLVLVSMYAFERGPYKGHAIWSTLLGSLYVAGISSLGLVGAMKWNLQYVEASTAALAALFFFRFCRLDWFDAILAGFLVYANGSLAMDMRSGALTPETFAEEEYVHESGRDFVEMANHYISPVETMV